MTDKTTSTTELQDIIPANVLLEISDAPNTQNKEKTVEADLGTCLLPFFQNLSLDAKNNIISLRKLQREQIEHEISYYKESHILELKYEKLYDEIFRRRREIIMGLNECRINIDDKAKDNNIVVDVNKDKTKTGLDKFWLNVFLNSNTLSKEIYPCDESILKHLKDVTRRYHPEGSMNFILEFHFEPNEYFTNSVLTKEYEVRGIPDEEDPFNYDGPTIVKCKGCTIDWKEGKNPTVKTIRKKKQKGIAKTVKRKSFFNFFCPPIESEEGDMDEDMDDLLTYDYEIGDYIKERIIPRAVAYYTKEVDFGSEDSEEDSNTDSSEDHDKKQSHQARSRRKTH